MKTKLKILLAEDNQNDVKLLEIELRKEKILYEMIVVENEEDYRKAIAGFNPDIIISDYSMPVFDGMTALRIKKEICPNIPFIIATGSINEETAVICLKAGADDYVIKEQISQIIKSIKASLKTYELNREKQKAQQDLIQSEAQLSNALQIARLGPWEYDVENDIFTFNDLFYSIFRTTAEKVGGYTMSSAEYAKKFVHPEDARLVGIQVKKAIETNDRNFKQQLEHRIIYADNGEVGYIIVRIFIIKNENGKTIKTFGVNQDITESKRVEAELINAKNKAEEMNKLKSSFLANMSHELRTPMVGILGFSEILANELDNSELKNFATSIYKSGKRLLNTLNLILDLSRIEANRQDLVLMDHNIPKLIRELVLEYSILAENKGIYLINEIKRENVFSNTDERLFRSVIGNLIDNAIKYTNEGGVSAIVDVENEDGIDWVVIKIKDTGIGIPDDYLQTIFEEFRQVSEGWSRSYEGTGLGLTIAKRFTDLLKGKISVESTLHVGSTFKIMIPLKKTVTESSDKKNRNLIEKNIANIRSTSKDFLLIDDDKYVYDIISKLFADIPHSYADTETKALILLKNKKYSLILLDINLGSGVEGVEVLKKIRVIPGYKEIPVIAITAYAMVNDKERFLNNGFDDYISKPFDKKELVNIISKYISV